MALFSLIAKLGLDKTGFDAGLSAAQSSAMKFGTGLKNQLAAAFSVAALTAYTRSLIEYASKVKDASVRTGASTDALQALGHAAKLTGSDFEAVVRSFKDLSKARQEALDDPRSKALQVFRALGIDGQKLKDLKLEDLFREIGRAFEGQDFGASELAMVTELLGRAGGELLPMFKEGMDELEKQAVEAGVVLGEELIDPLDELGDQLDVLVAQLRGPFAEALVGTLKLANEAVDKLLLGFKSIVGYIHGFQKGMRAPEEARPLGLPKWVTESPVGRLARIFAKGHKEAVDLLEFEAAKQEQKAEGEGPADGLMMVRKQDAKDRKRREFHFENLLKEREPQVGRIQSDSLGRIGGTVGGGDATQTKLTELVRETKELRRTLEIRGVRISGEL